MIGLVLTLLVLVVVPMLVGAWFGAHNAARERDEERERIQAERARIEEAPDKEK